MRVGSERLAKKLLQENGHLKTFEVDPGDMQAADLLKRALEAYGCSVERDGFSTRLIVICPEASEETA